MKNIRKIISLLCLLLIAIVFTFTGINLVNAAPKTTTVKRDGVIETKIGDKNVKELNFSWATYVTSEGKIAYCLDNTKSWPSESGTSMTLSGEADAGIKYILENGYPYKTITNNAELDRYITQGAVWMYFGQLNSTFMNADDPYGLISKMQKLVNEAKGAKKTSSEFSLNVNVNTSNMSLSNDKKYYVSSEIAPELKGASTYKVTVSGVEGVIATTTSGKTQSEYSASEKFLVKIPVSSLKQTANIEVKVSATGQSNAYIFTPADSSIQRVASIYPGQTIEKTIKLTATVKNKNKDQVCVDYVIVGNVIPDPAKTDPTPGSTCYDKGTKYTQEKELTTRQTNCKFNGWYTKSDLTGKWTNGTALNNDMTLYGAWDCTNEVTGTEVKVPSTGANTPIITIAAGLVTILTGVGLYTYRSKKISLNK